MEQIARASLLLAFGLHTAGAQSTTKEPNEGCGRPSGWLGGDYALPELGQYNRIEVKEDGYVINGMPQNEAGFKRYLQQLRNLSVSPDALPSYIFLVSDKNVSCRSFSAAAAALESAYGCNKRALCMWGYGLGDRAYPRNVPHSNGNQ